MGWTMQWQAGRQLASMSKTGTNISFKYDDSGIRTSKTVNGITTSYTTIDGRITSQKTGNHLMYFYYDADNNLIGLNHNGIDYVYVKNLQGDIIGIVNQSGNIVAEYAYDAWGNALTEHAEGSIGYINPMRYRGYYFDVQTGFYYCQSRYYNPEVRRWISADEPVVLELGDLILAGNLFTYCNNDAVNRVDTTGYASRTRFWWGWRIFLSNDETKRMIDRLDIAAYIIGGLLTGFIPGFGKIFGIAIGAIWRLKKNDISNKNKGKGITIDFSWGHIAGMWWNFVIIAPLLPVRSR